MENEFWGGRFRGESLKVVDVAFVYQHVPSQKHNYDFYVKGIIKDLAFDFVWFVCSSWKSKPLWVRPAEGFPDQVNSF